MPIQVSMFLRGRLLCLTDEIVCPILGTILVSLDRAAVTLSYTEKQRYVSQIETCGHVPGLVVWFEPAPAAIDLSTSGLRSVS